MTHRSTRLAGWLVLAGLLLSTPALAQQTEQGTGRTFGVPCAPGGNGCQPVPVAGTVTPAPTTLTPASTATAVSNQVLKASAGTLYGGSVTATVAGYLLIFNAAALPANGTVSPVKCVTVPANQTVGFSADAGTAWTFSTGITLGFSTTGCYNLTASSTAFFTGQFQ